MRQGATKKSRKAKVAINKDETTSNYIERGNMKTNEEMNW